MVVILFPIYRPAISYSWEVIPFISTTRLTIACIWQEGTYHILKDQQIETTLAIVGLFLDSIQSWTVYPSGGILTLQREFSKKTGSLPWYSDICITFLPCHWSAVQCASTCLSHLILDDLANRHYGGTSGGSHKRPLRVRSIDRLPLTEGIYTTLRCHPLAYSTLIYMFSTTPLLVDQVAALGKGYPYCNCVPGELTSFIYKSTSSFSPEGFILAYTRTKLSLIIP